MLRDVLQSINSGLLVELLGSSSFLPSSLFASGEEGVWYDPSDISVLFQDNTGATPVTAPGQTIGLVLDKSSNGFNATQATTAARPSYIVDADGVFIQHDPVDDALTVTLPDLGTEATVAYVTRSEVRLLEDQTISGSYTLPAQELANFVVIDRALTFAEKVNLIRYLASKVEGVNYGAEIDRLTLIAINAVDVFVYDTTKDSDGGAWRNGALAQASSWYNETLNTATRGSRRDFPAVAVIVAEAAKVTIYDGDDPALPMWMVFNTGNNYAIFTISINTIAAKDGLFLSGGPTYGMSFIDFLSDGVWYSASSAAGQFSHTIATRNTIATTLASSRFGTIVNGTVNDVAMTVLPDAPIDPATGLARCTIAVATAGGVSVIKDDGTVVNSASTRSYSDLAILDTFAFHAIWGGGESTDYFNDIRNLSSSFTTSRSFNSATVPKLNVAGQVSTAVTAITGGFVQGTISNKSLNVVAVNPADVSKSSVAYISSTYNTGWMPGNIKGAFLSSTDTASLVGSGELVTNGTFDTDTSGWTDVSTGSGYASWSAGGLEVYRLDGSNCGYIYQTIPCAVGDVFQISAERVSGSGTAMRIGSTGGGNQLYDVTLGSGVTTIFVKAISTLISVGFRGAGDGSTTTIDNVSVKLADADRSVNNNGLIVNGTVTRSPVATGAELVGYSGFSASNYLEQPYNSALDFGTGDFCVMGWVKLGSAGITRQLFQRYNGSSGAYFDIYQNAANQLVFRCYSDQTITYSAPVGAWVFVTMRRASGVFYVYVNGLLVGSGASMSSLTSTSAVLTLGNNPAHDTPLTDGSLALWRISATAPTAEAIKKIYNDEKHLFTEGAACTLYGTSDAVTALAHDSDTGLLHVGTSAGRSVFQGLRRVSNTTTAVGTAISASNGLVVEE